MPPEEISSKRTDLLLVIDKKQTIHIPKKRGINHTNKKSGTREKTARNRITPK